MFIQVGVIAKPHGYKGDFLAAQCEGQDSSLGHLQTLYLDNVPYKILEAAWMPKGWKLRLEGISSDEAVNELRGKPLFAKREDLPQLDSNEYYVGDLIGAEVRDATSDSPIGTLTSVEPVGSPSKGPDRWWLSIAGEDVAIIATQHFVAKIDGKNKVIWVRNLEELKE